MPKPNEHPTCTCTDGATAVIRVTLTTIDGEVLDTITLCRSCAEASRRLLDSLGLMMGRLPTAQ